jgi:hypothetical protein
MTAEKLVRASGVAAIISAVTTFAFFALHPFSGEPPSAATVLGSNYVFVHMIGMVGIVFLLPALTALYLVQAKPTGMLGLIGFFLALAGAAMIMGFLWADGLYSPLLATRAPLLLDQGATQYYTGAVYAGAAVAAVVFDAGWIAFAIATVRAKVLPAWAIVAATIGAVLTLLPPPPLSSIPWGVFILGAALVLAGQGWLGWFLWRDADRLAQGA